VEVEGRGDEPGGAIATDASSSARAARLRLYLGGQGSWYLSLGIQFVLFPYLVAQELDESAAKVGIAQMTLMAPSLLFILLGGTVADHGDVRRILLRVHALAAVPPAILAVLLMTGHLSYNVLIVYALAMGTLSAFAMPARDSALTRIAETDIQQAVTLAMSAQMVSQLLGMLIVSFAAMLGAPLLLLFQMVMLLIGGLATQKLAPLPPAHDGSDTSRWAQILDGIAAARENPIVFAVIGLNFAVGLFYVGSFMVVLPLMVRDVYHSSDAQFTARFAMINIAFWGGTIAATFILLKIGHIERRGRVMMGAVTTGLIILAAMSFAIPFWTLCLLCFLWGMGAGTTMTMGRTIVQLAARASHRARVLALYQLGFSGGAPIGSLIMGFIVGGIGIYEAVLVPSGVMILIVALLLISPIWSYRAEEASA